MKTILLVLILFTTNLAAQQTEWYHLNADLLKVSFIGKSSVFALGTNGVVIRSVDKGMTWQQIPTIVQDSLLGIGFSDSLHGTIVGTNGKMMITNDAGVTWKIKLLPTTRTLRSISFKGIDGIIVGDEGTIFISNDGGSSWVQKESPTKVNLYSTLFVSDSILIGAQYGYLLLSNNNGTTWKMVDTLPGGGDLIEFSMISNGTVALTDGKYVFKRSTLEQKWKGTSLPSSVRGLAFSNFKNGFAVGPSLCMYQSVDGGATFSLFTDYDSSLVATRTDFTSIAFSDEQTGIAVGTKKTIYRTADGGKHWDLVSYLLQNNSWYDCEFISPDTGFICGAGLKIFRTKDGGATWLPQLQKIGEIVIFRNYFALHFFNSQEGIVLPVQSDSLLRTTDGGNSYKTE